MVCQEILFVFFVFSNCNKFQLVKLSIHNNLTHAHSKMVQGGTLNAFYILTLWHPMTTFLSGMRIWVWSILMQRSKYQN